MAAMAATALGPRVRARMTAAGVLMAASARLPPQRLLAAITAAAAAVVVMAAAQPARHLLAATTMAAARPAQPQLAAMGVAGTEVAEVARPAHPMVVRKLADPHGPHSLAAAVAAAVTAAAASPPHPLALPAAAMVAPCPVPHPPLAGEGVTVGVAVAAACQAPHRQMEVGMASFPLHHPLAMAAAAMAASLPTHLPRPTTAGVAVAASLPTHHHPAAVPTPASRPPAPMATLAAAAATAAAGARLTPRLQEAAAPGALHRQEASVDRQEVTMGVTQEVGGASCPRRPRRHPLFGSAIAHLHRAPPLASHPRAMVA